MVKVTHNHDAIINELYEVRKGMTTLEAREKELLTKLENIEPCKGFVTNDGTIFSKTFYKEGTTTTWSKVKDYIEIPQSVVDAITKPRASYYKYNVAK